MNIRKKLRIVVSSLELVYRKVVQLWNLIIMQGLQFMGQSPPPGHNNQEHIRKEKDTILMDKTKVTELIDTGEDFEQTEGWFRSWFKWCPTSMSLLRAAEKRILSYVKTPYKGQYVNIGPVVGKDDSKIWTISLTENGHEKTPLVMVHGLGSGVALWALNLDGLSNARPIYAFDLLGFGRSSRPSFSSDALDAERELVQSMEEWRREMKLERFVLLGHSMGGFLATSYAIRYPSRVSHLILADPWGFPEKPSDLSQKYPIPLWVKMIAYFLQPLNPLWGIRVAGPMGPKLIEKVRPDLIKKFAILSEDGDAKIADYIFHCNAQTPSGESAFHSLMSSFGWAKYPMINRIPSLRKDVPMTLIYGSRSWVDHCPGAMIQQMRPTSYVDVQIIQGAGHHVYADKREKFNDLVLKAAALGDENNLSRYSQSQAQQPSLEDNLESSNSNNRKKTIDDKEIRLVEAKDSSATNVPSNRINKSSK